jgi:hypothetical protein
MQSYINHNASEFLKDRLPYQDNFPKPEYDTSVPIGENEKHIPIIDPQEVANAYNTRSVPKLANLLVYEGLPSNKRRDALKTLNELVSHQETKATMISYNIVTSTINLLSDNNHEVRYEAGILIGSLLYLDIGRKQFDSRKSNYIILQNIIFDHDLSVRESVGWLLYRFSLHADGILMLVESNTVVIMVEAIKKYSEQDKVNENKHYLIYLLDAFVNISTYDYGSLPMLGLSLLYQFNKILADETGLYKNTLSNGIYEQIIEYILNTLKNITLTKEGKKEALDEKLIYTVSLYLTSARENERLFSSSFMMSVAISSDAKKQICNYIINDKFEILEVLCHNSENIYPAFRSQSRYKI